MMDQFNRDGLMLHHLFLFAFCSLASLYVTAIFGPYEFLLVPIIQLVVVIYKIVDYLIN